MPITIKAKYDGSCACCGDDIEEGEDITLSEYHDGWIPNSHEDCIEEAEEENDWKVGWKE